MGGSAQAGREWLLLSPPGADAQAFCRLTVGELEAALDAGDRKAAARAQRRLRDALAASASVLGEAPADAGGRRARAEARAAQLGAEAAAPLVCSLFPDIWRICGEAPRWLVRVCGDTPSLAMCDLPADHIVEGRGEADAL